MYIHIIYTGRATLPFKVHFCILFHTNLTSKSLFVFLVIFTVQQYTDIRNNKGHRATGILRYSNINPAELSELSLSLKTIVPNRINENPVLNYTDPWSGGGKCARSSIDSIPSLRVSVTADYILPRTRTKIGQRGFCYSGPATWNSFQAKL